MLISKLYNNKVDGVRGCKLYCRVQSLGGRQLRKNFVRCGIFFVPQDFVPFSHSSPEEESGGGKRIYQLCVS